MIYVRILGFSFLAGLLIFIAKNDFIFEYLIEHEVLSEEVNVEGVQFYLFIIGISWAGLWLPIEHARLKSRQLKRQEKFIDLLSYNKESYFKLIKNKLKAHNVDFKVRVFRPQSGIKAYWNKKINGKTILELVNIAGISDEFHHATLHFEINGSEVQGLVGKCFSDKQLWVDLNTEHNNYSLTEQHQTKIGDIKFCSAIPIFNADQSKVTAVLSVDSDHEFNFNNNDRREWKNHMIYLAAFVDKHTSI